MNLLGFVGSVGFFLNCWVLLGLLCCWFFLICWVLLDLLGLLRCWVCWVCCAVGSVGFVALLGLLCCWVCRAAGFFEVVTPPPPNCSGPGQPNMKY